MVEVHARDDRDCGSQNIRRVQSAAKPYFENAKIHPLARKVFKRHRGDAFKVRRMSAKPASGKKLLVQSLDASKCLGERVVADLFPIHADALVDLFKMRRSVQAGSKSGMPQNRFEKRSGRTLAVRSRDMRRRVSAIGPAKPLGKNGDVFEVEFRSSGLRRRSQLPAQRQ